MTEKSKSRAPVGLTLVSVMPAEIVAAAPAAPVRLGLRRAAELVEKVAFDLAGRESPATVSRLIEIAAELERLAMDRASMASGLGAARPIRLD